MSLLNKKYQIIENQVFSLVKAALQNMDRENDKNGAIEKG